MVDRLRVTRLALILCFLLAACSPVATPVPTAAPATTAAPAATAAPAPSPTAASASPAPIGTTERETLLILINLGSRPVEGYTLALDEGLPAGAGRPGLLMGDAAEVAIPVADASGGFTGYTPVAVLPPNSTYILQFAP